MICCYSINVLSSKIPAETADLVKKSHSSGKIEDIYLFSKNFSLFYFPFTFQGCAFIF